MNSKEMESAIKDQQAMIEGLRGRIQAQDTLIEGMKAVIEGAPSRDQYDDLGRHFAELEQKLTAMRDDQTTSSTALENLGLEVARIDGVVEDHTAKIEGRNKSAPTKRNMTDADAKAVLDGEYKELGHKEAAEKIGLTYAQVYSCRLEFTFKHVHKELRDAGWKNTFVK